MATPKHPKPVLIQTPLVSSWELVRPSVQLIIRNIDTMLWLVILPAVLGFLASVLLNPFTETLRETLNNQPTDAEFNVAVHHFWSQVASTGRGHVAVGLEILATAWMFFAFPAVIAFMTYAVVGKPADLRSSFAAGMKYFVRIYALTILTTFAVIGGLFLLVIPGFIMLRRYVLAPFYLIEHNLNVRDAMQMSARETKPHAAFVWGTLGVLIGFLMLNAFLSGLGYIGAFAGLIVSYLYFFGPALRYQTIKEAIGSSAKTPKK